MADLSITASVGQLSLVMQACIMIKVEDGLMATLTVTTRGQVTFRREVLKHLGIEPGGKIELDLLPDGRAALKAAEPAGSIKAFFGLLAGKTSKVATLEEIEAAIAKGWAGER